MGFNLYRSILAISLCLIMFTQGAHAKSKTCGVITDTRFASMSPVELEIKPRNRIPPKYPRAAAEKKVEGWALVDFYVDTEGKVSNISHLDSGPPGIFEKATEQGINRWRYRPNQIDSELLQQKQRLLMTFEVRSPRSSRSFRKIEKQSRKALEVGDPEALSVYIKQLQHLFRGSRQEYRILETLYGKYFLLTKDNARAIHHLQRATHYASELFQDEPDTDLLRLIFDLKINQGLLISALQTYYTLCEADALMEDDPAHSSALEIDALLQSSKPLSAQGFIGGSCYGCVEGEALWEHQLARSSFQIDQVRGRIRSLRLSCDHHQEDYEFEPHRYLNFPAEWGRCSIQVKGSTGSKFRLVER